MYVILEIQKASDGTVSIAPVSTANTLNAARSTFYTICASAAISSVAVHSVALLTDTGQTIGLESFDHTGE